MLFSFVYLLWCSSIKFCSYNFVVNEVANNNDIMRVANIMLKKAPNNNDTTHVMNNVLLTTMGTQLFPIAAK